VAAHTREILRHIHSLVVGWLLDLTYRLEALSHYFTLVLATPIIRRCISDHHTDLACLRHTPPATPQNGVAFLFHIHVAFFALLPPDHRADHRHLTRPKQMEFLTRIDRSHTAASIDSEWSLVHQTPSFDCTRPGHLTLQSS